MTAVLIAATVTSALATIPAGVRVRWRISNHATTKEN